MVINRLNIYSPHGYSIQHSTNFAQSNKYEETSSSNVHYFYLKQHERKDH